MEFWSGSELTLRFAKMAAAHEDGEVGVVFVSHDGRRGVLLLVQRVQGGKSRYDWSQVASAAMMVGVEGKRD